MTTSGQHGSRYVMPSAKHLQRISAKQRTGQRRKNRYAPGGIRTRFEHFAFRHEPTDSAELRGFLRTRRHRATSENSQLDMECGQKAGKNHQCWSASQAHAKSECGQVQTRPMGFGLILSTLIMITHIRSHSAKCRLMPWNAVTAREKDPRGMSGRHTGPCSGLRARASGCMSRG